MKILKVLTLATLLASIAFAGSLKPSGLKQVCEEATICGNNHECNTQKCLIKNARSLEQALQYDLAQEIVMIQNNANQTKPYQSYMTRFYEALLRLPLPADNSETKHQIRVCYEEETCAPTEVLISRQGDSLRIQYQTLDVMYEKTYKIVKEGVEARTISYI